MKVNINQKKYTHIHIKLKPKEESEFFLNAYDVLRKVDLSDYYYFHQFLLRTMAAESELLAEGIGKFKDIFNSNENIE